MAQCSGDSSPTPSKRPRHHDIANNGEQHKHPPALEPLLFYPQAQEEGGEGAAAFPSLKHTDPECHVRLSAFLRGAGLRTALVSAPHRAVSVLVHAEEAAVAGGRDDVWLMLGVHPRQAEMEAEYGRRHRHRKAALAFLQDLLKNLRPPSRAAVGAYLQAKETALLQPPTPAEWEDERACAALVAEVISTFAHTCPENRVEALQREAWRQRCRHTSLANALLQRFISQTALALQDALFRPSPSPGLSRLTLVLWEPSAHQPRPPQSLLLLPAAYLVLRPPPSMPLGQQQPHAEPQPLPTPPPPLSSSSMAGQQQPHAHKGPTIPPTPSSSSSPAGRQPDLHVPEGPAALAAEALVQQLVSAFWGHMWRYGYYAAAALLGPVSQELAAFFHAGLVQHGKMSLLAGFAPKRHLSLYLQGEAGTGKSSFVAKLVPALAATIEELLDPEMDVRFVKQALNKPLAELDRELTLRPNNNDLSVMGIIQGRRQTLQQAKPGLVVVGLEEVPPADHNSAGDGQADGEGEDEQDHRIEQRATLTLLADRFSGLRGSGTVTTAEDRARLLRQNRGGISDHPEVLTVFTSNYPLDPEARQALAALPMFRHVVEVALTAIQDEERRSFARAYLAHCLHEQLQRHEQKQLASSSASSAAKTASDNNGHASTATCPPFYSVPAAVTANDNGHVSPPVSPPLVPAAVTAGDDNGHTPTSAAAAFAAWGIEVERGYLSTLTDVRDLVRHLGAVAFATAPRLLPLLLCHPAPQTLSLSLSHSHESDASVHVHISSQQPQQPQPPRCLLSLRPGTDERNRGLLFPIPPTTTTTMTPAVVVQQHHRHQHPVARTAAAAMRGRMGDGGGENIAEETAHVLTYFFHDVLAPAVLLFVRRCSPRCSSSSSSSSSSELVQALFSAITAEGEGEEGEGKGAAIVSGLGPIDAERYRIVRSLYDAREDRNLRDDIRALRQNAPEARVAVYIQAPTTEAQLKLRELLEDTPSMVAFSTARSALQKRGLLFLVEVGGQLTPELRSRASLVISV